MKKLLILLIFLLMFRSALAFNLAITWNLSRPYLTSSVDAILSLIIQNNENEDVRDVEIKFDSQFFNVSPNYYKIDSIESGKNEKLYFVVKNTIQKSGSYLLNFLISYKTLTEKKEKEFSIPVVVKNYPFLIIRHFTPVNVSSEEFRIKIMIKNTGFGIAKKVQVFSNSSLFTLNQPPIYFEEIRPKEEKAVSLLFKVQEQKVGKYVLPILLTYKDESEENTFSSTYFIPVTILSRDEVYILIEKIETKNGMKNIRLKIVNAGPSKIKFLTLNFQNAHPTTIYVGNLDSDDYSIEQISIPITENKIVFNFTYVNELDEKIAEERIISLEGFKEEKKEEIKESSCREYVYLFAILFLILIIIFYKLRK